MTRTIRAGLLLVAPALTLSAQAPRPAPALCWRSLAPETGNQDLGLGTTEPALSSAGPDDVWLSREENGPRILRWRLGSWSTVPIPTRPGFEDISRPLVAATATGSAFLALYGNGQNGTSAVLIARMNRGAWEWLGTPLLSSRKAFTHANDTSIAIANDGQPVVAWAEERGVTLAGLFVALWDGSSWQRLGSIRPEGSDYYLSPTVVVDSEKKIWLGWKQDSNEGLRVARWNGSAWADVGRVSLSKLPGTQGRIFEPSLIVDKKGHAWLAWIASKEDGESSLSLARWDGSKWEALAPPPSVPVPKGGRVSSVAMALQGGVPLLAWSQSDHTENERLFVSEWGEGDQWRARLSGLHLVEGFSDVSAVKLATAGEQSFFVSWDEQGTDERRSRLVQAYTCAPGETPAAPPKSIVERDTWPTTVDQAARRIVDELNEEGKARVRGTKREDLIQFHQGWGTGIRNELGLWRGNEKLLMSCGQGKIVVQDSCSMTIIEAVWNLLQIPPG